MIDTGWEIKKLKNVAKVYTGIGFPKNLQGKSDGEFPFYKVGDISKNVQKGKFNLPFCENFIDKEDLNELRGKLIPRGTVVFAKIGEALKLNRRGIINRPSLIDNNAIGIKSIDDLISDKYMFYLWQDIRLEDYSRATTVPSVRKTDIEEIEIPVPPLPSQHRIVEKIEELFSELDNGVENLKKAQIQLKSYRQAVLKDAFEGKLTKEWREQQDDLPTPEELLQQIKAERKAHRQHELAEWEKEVEQWKKDGKPGSKPRKPSKPKILPQITESNLSSLPEIPTSWRYTYLYDLGDLGRGKSKHRPRNDERLFKGGTIPFIQTGEVKAASKYLRTFEDTYNEFGLSQSKLWPTGTLCITIAANIAETAILDIEACFPDSIVGYTSYSSITDKLFVYYFIQSVQKRLEAFAPATAQKNINLTTLENLLVPLCSLKEQKEIVNEIESRLSVVDQLEQTIKENLQKAEALRQSILKKAFGGELVL